MYRSHVLVCGGTGCTSSGSEQIIQTLKDELKKNKLQNEVAVVKTGCHGLCAEGPVMIVYPEAVFYSRVRPEDVEEIVSEHLLKGRIVERLVYHEAQTPEGIKSLNETTFYKKQHRIALRNCGVINPESIDEYIGTGGYEALGKVLTEMTPDEVIQTILDSGLRGRGGAGFPTGLKWRFASGNRGNVQKYVCCNADEGDPGAFMDRSVLEGDPHVVLEAMAIAGYAIGADQGYIYVRAEYPIAVERLQIAINQAREYGLLGKNIFDTGFNFSIQTVSNDCTLYLPTDKSYNGILCSIINGSEWIFPGTSTVNHYRVIVKLDNDDRFCSNHNNIIRYITISTGRMVRLKAVLRRNKLEWFVLNYQDFTWDNDGQHIYI